MGISSFLDEFHSMKLLKLSKGHKFLNHNEKHVQKLRVMIMVFTVYNGVFSGGFLTFLMVLFCILAVASIIWFLLYIEMSQQRNWKLSTLIIVITSLFTAFAIQLILVKIGVIL